MAAIQKIEVNDTTKPTVSAPADKTGANHVEGCNTAAITGLAYSESPVSIMLAQLTGEGGGGSGARVISWNIYPYRQAGSCPIVVTRTFTVKDAGMNAISLHDALPIYDTTKPTVSAPADKTGANHVEGCNTAAITGLAYSESPVGIMLAQLTGEGGDRKSVG